jgi:hypothetical protein
MMPLLIMKDDVRKKSNLEYSMYVP